MYLKELAYIEEGPKYVKNGLINVDKIKRIGLILNDFLEFKTNAYLFKLLPNLAFLYQLKTRTEDQLIDLSNKLGR